MFFILVQPSLLIQQNTILWQMDSRLPGRLRRQVREVHAWWGKFEGRTYRFPWKVPIHVRAYTTRWVDIEHHWSCILYNIVIINLNFFCNFFQVSYSRFQFTFSVSNMVICAGTPSPLPRCQPVYQRTTSTESCKGSSCSDKEFISKDWRVDPALNHQRLPAKR